MMLTFEQLWDQARQRAEGFMAVSRALQNLPEGWEVTEVEDTMVIAYTGRRDMSLGNGRCNYKGTGHGCHELGTFTQSIVYQGVTYDLNLCSSHRLEGKTLSNTADEEIQVMSNCVDMFEDHADPVIIRILAYLIMRFSLPVKMIKKSTMDL
jgi:hypothetical protein